jgi:hypothetical protein
MGTEKYRYTGEHAQEITIGENRVMVAPGAFVDLSDDDVEANHVVFNDGLLVNVEGSEVSTVEEPETGTETETTETEETTEEDATETETEAAPEE